MVRWLFSSNSRGPSESINTRDRCRRSQRLWRLSHGRYLAYFYQRLIIGVRIQADRCVRMVQIIGLFFLDIVGIHISDEGRQEEGSNWSSTSSIDSVRVETIEPIRTGFVFCPIFNVDTEHALIGLYYLLERRTGVQTTRNRFAWCATFFMDTQWSSRKFFVSSYNRSAWESGVATQR